MFDVDCPHHGRRVLLPLSAVEALVNTPDGVRLRWRCYCGARGERHAGRLGSGARVDVAA